MSELAKTHILFPKALLRKIDRMAGTGHRSRFVIEAAEEKLARLNFLRALDAASGTWSLARHPDLATQRELNSFLQRARKRTHRRLTKTLNG